MTAHIRPPATAPVTLEQAVALVDEASGAGSDAIEALESAAHAHAKSPNSARSPTVSSTTGSGP